MSSAQKKPRVAWLHRFGAAEHTELFHGLPHTIEQLARDYEVHFYGFKGRKPLPDLIARHAVMHEIPIYTDRSSPSDIKLKLMLWTLLLPFIALICRFKRMKVVYLDEGVPLFGIIMLFFYGSTTVMTVADFYTDIYLNKNWFTRIFGKALVTLDFFAWKRLKLVITRAKTTRNYLLARGFKPDRIVTVYDPLDTELFHPLNRSECKKQFGYDDSHFVLVCHGILHPNKGVDWLIRVFGEVRGQYPQMRLLIVGGGSEGPALRALAEQLKLTDVVKFTGWLPGSKDINRAINAADLGVIMRVGNESDHFHITGGLVHNMACGIPVLSVRLRGVQEIITDGENGFLFEPGDKVEFKQKLDLLVRDEALRRQFGQKTYDFAMSFFANEKIAAILAEALKRVAEGQPHPIPPDAQPANEKTA